MTLRKIDAMHAQYGAKTGICRECCNFVKGRYHGRYYRKCAAYGMTNSEATDWAGKWEACGLFGQEFDDTKQVPLLQSLKHGHQLKMELPLEWQETIYD